MKHCLLKKEDIIDLGKSILQKQIIIANKNFKLKHLQKEIKKHFNFKQQNTYILTFEVFNAYDYDNITIEKQVLKFVESYFDKKTYNFCQNIEIFVEIIVKDYQKLEIILTFI